MAGQLVGGKDINPYTGEIVEGRYDPATDSIIRPGKPAIPLNRGIKQFPGGTDINPYTGETVEGRYDPQTDSIIKPGQSPIPLNGGKAPAPAAPQSRNDSRESGGIPQKGTNMGGGLAAFDLSAAESWLGGEMRDPFNSSPLPGSPDSFGQYAALADQYGDMSEFVGDMGGFGDNVEIQFKSKVDPGAYSDFNAVETLNRTDIPQDIFPVDLKNTEMKPAAQSEGGYKPDLARRAAFLDAKDSMAGMKAVNRHMGTVVNAGNHYIRKGDELVGLSREQYRDYMRGDVGAQALLKDTVKAVTDGGAESPASRTQLPNFPDQGVDYDVEGPKSDVTMGQEDFMRSNTLPGEVDEFVNPESTPMTTGRDYF